MRAPFILAGHIMCLIGFSIQISNAPSGVKYFGTFFCVAGSYSAFPGVISWSASFDFESGSRATKQHIAGWQTMWLGSTNVALLSLCILALEISPDVSLGTMTHLNLPKYWFVCKQSPPFCTERKMPLAISLEVSFVCF